MNLKLNQVNDEPGNEQKSVVNYFMINLLICSITKQHVQNRATITFRLPEQSLAQQKIVILTYL